ncbi:MBL fold metallo-hydrolase [Streptomyces radiopugnans]|uniref:Glyoxylase, beta-lactamase superfamily II n=1 Tax=Streptomyces radiopugnans TaxID=403935 RepID=A0A1H9B6H0_9ACTN|nr:MBL fold metallo-hydrolase [Streptomyces radiopugnans]SEP84544.1 Glyoxylase, beta-lactamase superfamily II [Streptomyces radiopugnans]
MTRRRSTAPAPRAREIAPGVYCPGPWGHTRTNVYLVRSGPHWALVDTGWAADAPRVERAAASLFGPGSRPAAVLLTHCHPDHAGSAPRLAREWGCPVHLHPGELPLATGDPAAIEAAAAPLDRRLLLPVMRAAGRRRYEAMLAGAGLDGAARAFDPRAAPPGLPDWECVHTPGHTPGHTAYFRPADRVLISGDALVTVRIGTVRGMLAPRPGLSGAPWYTTWDRRAARESVERLARLRPSVLAGGHGEPMTGPGAAAALEGFAVRAAARG